MKLTNEVKRKAIQIAAFGFSNAHVGNFAGGKLYTGKWKQFCNPGLNCYSCPAASLACPIGALQAVSGSMNYSLSFYTMKYVADKDRKPFCADLKTIYQAPTEEKALDALERVTEKWNEKYPNSMKSWKQNWDAISPIFKFSVEVRKVIYTTNAIESLNATYRKLNRQRSVFPSDTALLKALYLSTFEATKKWTMPLRNWGQVYGELSIMYEGRLPE